MSRRGEGSVTRCFREVSEHAATIPRTMRRRSQEGPVRRPRAPCRKAPRPWPWPDRLGRRRPTERPSVRAGASRFALLRGQAEAQASYEAATTHFNRREYDAAIALFSEAHQISQDPAFLFNIAQSYWHKKDCFQAILYYRRFLNAAHRPATARPSLAASRSAKPGSPKASSLRRVRTRPRRPPGRARLPPRCELDSRRRRPWSPRLGQPPGRWKPRPHCRLPRHPPHPMHRPSRRNPLRHRSR